MILTLSLKVTEYRNLLIKDRQERWRSLIEDEFLYVEITAKILDKSHFNCDIRNQKRFLIKGS